jgi:hypothetical protein
MTGFLAKHVAGSIAKACMIVTKKMTYAKSIAKIWSKGYAKV